MRAFQAASAAEEVNGLLGAESWPALVATAERAGGADVERAAHALADARWTEAAPGPRDLPAWQRLLGTGGAPIDQCADPPGLRPR